uniref:Uncharacterized protein n=1 Tax=Anguilla anguilla TaxID=7936 RepID=A0A0E9TG36_ANGAN
MIFVDPAARVVELMTHSLPY